MNQRVECTHCGRIYPVTEDDCPGCGASLPRSALAMPAAAGQGLDGAATGPSVVSADVAEVVAAYADIGEVHIPPIPEKKLRNATDAMNIPPYETVFALVDCTVFGSSKVGCAVGAAGLYWNTDWTTDTNLTFLTWTDLSQRTIAVDGRSISLGAGDNLDVATITAEDDRERIAQMLRDLAWNLG